MNEEEKKAIEKLKQTTQQCHNSKECWENESCPDCYVEVEDILAIETVLNLIDKQQKEIEEAIEYIENAKKELYGCGNYYLLDLLKILKGVKYE